MKPLLKNELGKFLDRFANFTSAEIRELNLISATSIEMVLATQDKARAFDWISLKIQFNVVYDARLVDENKLGFISMDNGISIINEDNKFAFGVGECYNISSIQNSVLYVLCSDIKYQEEIF
jgi:hypothetical protein